MLSGMCEDCVTAGWLPASCTRLFASALCSKQGLLAAAAAPAGNKPWRAPNRSGSPGVEDVPVLLRSCTSTNHASAKQRPLSHNHYRPRYPKHTSFAPSGVLTRSIFIALPMCTPGQEGVLCWTHAIRWEADISSAVL